MLSTRRSVLSRRVGSLSSLVRTTWTARSVGIHVNRDTTSKDTIISSSIRACLEMNSAKSLEFQTCELDCPTTGVSRLARNLDSLYVDDNTKDTMGWKGTSCLCIFSSLYSSGVLLAELLRDIYTPSGSRPDRFKFNNVLFMFFFEGQSLVAFWHG